MSHHTWTDWDWSDVNWELSAVRKYSAPTSLKFTTAGLTICLLKLPDALNLPEGKLVTKWWFDGNDRAILVFRNQEADGGSSFTNCYYVEFTVNRVRVYRRVNNSDTLIQQWTPSLTVSAWWLFTVTWWLYKEPYQADVLRIRVAGESPPGVAGFEEEVDDAANLWADQPVNRAGLAGQIQQFSNYYDDTEVWKPQ